MKNKKTLAGLLATGMALSGNALAEEEEKPEAHTGVGINATLIGGDRQTQLAFTGLGIELSHYNNDSFVFGPSFSYDFFAAKKPFRNENYLAMVPALSLDAGYIWEDNAGFIATMGYSPYFYVGFDEDHGAFSHNLELGSKFVVTADNTDAYLIPFSLDVNVHPEKGATGLKISLGAKWF